MIGIFKWVGSLFKSAGMAMIMPFTKIKSSSRSQAFIRWSFHFVCLAVSNCWLGLSQSNDEAGYAPSNACGMAANGMVALVGVAVVFNQLVGLVAVPIVVCQTSIWRFW